MRGAGHRVSVFAPPGDEAADAAVRAAGVTLRHYPLDRKGLNPLRDLATLAALYRLFRRERPDAAFCYTIKPVIYGCAAVRAAGVRGRYATITGLGYMFEADSPAKKLLARLAALLYREALRGATAVFFQNGEDMRLFLHTGILSAKHRMEQTRGTGVDTVRFAPADPPSGPPVFLLVGRLLEAKGIREYAEAARLLKRRHKETRFQLLGPPETGPGGVPLETVRAWEREGILDYLGETRDVRPYLAAASVVVLPSRREGAPCSIMEAMSTGRAVIVADSPGCREMVRDGVNGRVVPVRAPEALAKAMEHFILHPEDAARMGEAGRRLAVEEFDARDAAKQVLGVMGLLS
jgi:glycosyltransferase involved in cell wall biosynthesis